MDTKEHTHHESNVCEKHVVKRAGVEQHYDHRKVYGSVYAAALASGALKSKSTAEDIAAEVAFGVDRWIMERSEVTSDDIFKHVVELLKLRDPHIAFFYESHRVLS